MQSDPNSPGVTLQLINSQGQAIVASGAGAPPTSASVYGLLCRYTDTTNKIVYENVGTFAAPVWKGRGTRTITLSAADIIAMYTTPVLVVPAVPGKAIFVRDVRLTITRTSTAFTGGGVVAVQYNSTANGAGTLTHATIAASVVTGAAGTTYTQRIAAVAGQSDIASASIAGIGLYISNQTAVFAAGTGTASLTVDFDVE